MTKGPIFNDAFRQQLVELFRWRRDVRRFCSDPVSSILLDELLAVASLAPSVGLSQPWRVVTVDDPARRSAERASFVACNEEALLTQPAYRESRYANLKLAGLEEPPCPLAVIA